MHQAIQGLLQRKKVSGRILEVVVGHATFVALTCRSLLSIFNTTYRYIRATYYQPSILWKSVREELFAFRSLMIYLHSDWTRPWNNYVSASDSSLGGYGVVSLVWKRSEVARVGRNLERGRFKRIGPHSARESALTSAGFVRDEVTNEWKAGSLEDQEYLQLSGWGLNEAFEEVPGYLLQKGRWTPRLWGKWNHEAGILELEARALVKSLRRIALSIFGHDIRQLLLTDNMSVCLSFDRSRARSFAPLKQIRIFSAYRLARNISCTVRWIPSELNSADAPSRLDSKEYDESKSLTHAIPRTVTEAEGTHSEASFREVQNHSSQAESHLVSKPQKQSEPRASPAPEDSKFGQTASNSPEAGRVQPARCGFECTSEECQKGTLGEQHRLHQLDSERKEKEKNRQGSGEETEKKGSANGEPCHGRRQPHLPGKPSSGSGSFATIPEGARGIQPVPCPEEGGHQRPRSVGFVLDPLSEPDVCRRLSKLPRRSSDGGLASSPLRIRPKRIFEIAPFLASHAGLQKAHAWEIQEGNALGGLGCHCSRSEKDQPPENGSFPSSVRINLCQALGIAESQSVLSCPTSAGRDTMLVSPAVAGRARRKNQNWRVRHVFDVGQHVDDRVDFPHFGVLEEEPSRVSTVGLRLHSLPQGIPRHCAEVPVGHDTLHVPTQWSVNRPGKKLSQSTRSPKARPVESSEEHYALREECKAGSSVGVIAPAFPAARPKLRGKPWGDAVGAKRRSNLHRKRAVGNQYVLDLFAGDGGVARACEHLGFRAKEWDVRHGPAQDLTSPKTIKRIFREIRRGRVLACMMAPVDTSFSVARDRTKAIRNQTYPWGIESSHLTHEEKRSIELGNACFRTCLQIMHMLDQYCIPYILASPATSKAWLLPPIEEQLSKPFVTMVTADFCQFNTPWKKPTSFLVGHLDPADLHRLTKVCSGAQGLCSRTQRRHFKLTGVRRDGVRWAEVAQTFPRKLCQALAHALTAHRHAIHAATYMI